MCRSFFVVHVSMTAGRDHDGSHARLAKPPRQVRELFLNLAGCELAIRRKMGLERGRNQVAAAIATLARGCRRSYI